MDAPERIAMLVGHDLATAPQATRPLALARELAAAGCQVRLLHYPAAQNAPRLHAPADWGVAPIAVDKFRWRRATGLVRAAVDWCDVFHVEGATFCNDLMLRLAWERRAALVYDWSAWERPGCLRLSLHSKRRVWRIDPTARFVARRADAILYANDAIWREMARAYGRRDRVFRAPNGVDAAYFTPARIHADDRRGLRAALELPAGPVVACLGRQASAADHARLWELLRVLAAELEASFLVFGTRAWQARFESTRRTSGLSAAVRYLADVPYRAMPQYLALADAAVLALPGDLFGQCLSPLCLYEAMAMELPLVASRIGQAETALEPDCGVLTPAENPLQLAAALRDVLSRPWLARELGRRARARVVAGHTWRHVAVRVMEGYKAALARRTGAGRS